MRLYVLSLILALAMIVTVIALVQKPIDAPLVIDAQSPGVWPKYAAVDLCDIRTAPPVQPRGKYDYIPGAKAEGGIV